MKPFHSYHRPSFEKRVAYCALHSCPLSVKQLKVKGCAKKGCRALRLNKSHVYWETPQGKKLAKGVAV